MHGAVFIVVVVVVVVVVILFRIEWRILETKVGATFAFALVLFETTTDDGCTLDFLNSLS